MDKDGHYMEEGGFLPVSSEKIDEEKKNVLLLGDSIRAGYCEYTKAALSDAANVKYPDDNCRNTQYTYVSLAWWKNIFENTEKVNVVYWNNGHWDIAHWGGDEKSLNSVGQYCDMLCRIAKKLRKFFPNAKIIFATTTPANPNGSVGPNPRTNEEILKYNKAAISALSEEDVEIHDVYKLLSDI